MVDKVLKWGQNGDQNDSRFISKEFKLTHSDGMPEADPCTFLTSPIVPLQH